MEKLQVAIEHARNRRDMYSSGGFAPKTTNRNTAQKDPELWENLKTFTPKPRHLIRNRIMGPDDRSGVKTSVDILRTRLLAMLKENGWTRIMVTSPTSGCGKSTLVANLAMALHRQSDLRTLVFDLDLQRAELGAKFGLIPDHGVTEYLTGTASLADHIYKVGDNLAISAGRKKSKPPADLLKSSAAKSRIDEAETMLAANVVLFDMPPMFASDDIIATAGLVDCAVIVGAAEQTTVPELEEVERDLAQYTNIAGVVLNKCRSNPKPYGYDYGYR